MTKPSFEKPFDSTRSVTNQTRIQRIRAVLDAIQKVRAKRARKMADEVVEKAMKK